MKQIHESGPCACQLFDLAELKEMEEKKKRLFSCFANWDMWKMKILRPLAVFAQFPHFLQAQRVLQNVKKPRSRLFVVWSEGIDCQRLSWGVFFNLFSSYIYWKKTTFLLRGIMSKFLLIPNFLNQVQKMYVCNQPKCEATFMRRLPTKLISTTAAPNFDHHLHCWTQVCFMIP